MMRMMLYEAAQVMLLRSAKWSQLRPGRFAPGICRAREGDVRATEFIRLQRLVEEYNLCAEELVADL